MLYPPYSAVSEARSAQPDAPILSERAPRRRLQLPVVRPLRWRLVTRRPAFRQLTSRHLTGART